MLLDALQSYGLSEKEARIYLCCLEYGMVQPAKIAAKLGIHRSTCYDTLAILRTKGLVVETKKKGVLYYTAISPELLLSSLEQKYTSFKGVVPELMGLSQKFGIKPKIKIFEGLEGMKAMYEDTLSSEVDILAYCGNHVIQKDLLHYFRTEYLPKRVENAIFAKVLLSSSDANQSYHEESHKWHRESYFIDEEVVDISCEINLYGPNKVLVGLYDETEMAGLAIESRSLYETLKGLFMFTRKILAQQNTSLQNGRTVTPKTS